MLRDDHFDIHARSHVCPETAYLVAVHVALVKALHIRQQFLQSLGRLIEYLARAKVGPEITGEQDAALGIEKLEIALGVQEMCGYRFELNAAELQIHPFIRDRHNSAGELPRARKVRDETLPQSRHNDLAVGADQPFVQRGDNVRILVGSDHIVEALHVHVVADTHEQCRIGEVAARVDQCSMVTVADQELVGLHCLTRHQIAKRHTDVVALVIKFHCHHYTHSTRRTPRLLPDFGGRSIEILCRPGESYCGRMCSM